MSMKWIFKAGLLGSLVGLLHCSPAEDRTDRTALAREMRARKLKRVTDSQLMAAAMEEGSKAAAQLSSILYIPPSGNCDSVRINGALKSEVITDYRFICRSETDLPPKIAAVWQAYQYNLKQNIALSENIQKLEDGNLLYTVPIVQKGNFVGMWSIILSKKEIIRRL